MLRAIVSAGRVILKRASLARGSATTQRLLSRLLLVLFLEKQEKYISPLNCSFTKIKGYPLQIGEIYDNMFLYVLIYCYGDFHAEKISDCLSGIHGAFD